MFKRTKQLQQMSANTTRCGISSFLVIRLGSGCVSCFKHLFFFVHFIVLLGVVCLRCVSVILGTFWFAGSSVLAAGFPLVISFILTVWGFLFLSFSFFSQCLVLLDISQTCLRLWVSWLGFALLLIVHCYCYFNFFFISRVFLCLLHYLS